MARDAQRNAITILEGLGVRVGGCEPGRHGRAMDRKAFLKAPPGMRARIARERMRGAASRLALGPRVGRRPFKSLAMAFAAGFMVGQFAGGFKLAARSALWLARHCARD